MERLPAINSKMKIRELCLLIGIWWVEIGPAWAKKKEILWCKCFWYQKL